MEHIETAISKFSAKRYEEDFVDRLNFQATTLVFMASSALIAYQEYFGEPLQCWTPMQFTDGWDGYTNTFCFIENTYYTPVANKSLPDDNMIRDNAKLPYYQWVPWVLALQAMCFCFPHVFWRMVNWMSGVHVRAIVTMATDSVSSIKKGVDEESLTMIVNHLRSGLRMSRGRHRLGLNSNPFGWIVRILTKRSSCYITFCYLIMKSLFIANIFVQLAVHNFFLDIPSGSTITWGFILLKRLASGHDWSITEIFPRVTMCDFEVRALGNLHRWSVQCVLPLNMFNEKVFVALWFWMYFVLAITVANTVQWIFQIISDERRRQFIEDLIDVAKVMDPSDLKNMHQDVIIRQICDDLGWDGILILRIIMSNSGEFPCVAIVKQIYKRYAEEYDL